MIHLTPTTANQRFYVTPFQARKFLRAFTNYLVVLVNEATKEEKAFVANVEYDNERYTQCLISTNLNSPAAGSVVLTDSGLYTYTIYGQNSSTNLDPQGIAVVGQCETGSLRVEASAAWETESITIPDNVIYYE